MHYAWSYSNNALSKLEQYIASENLSMKAGNSQYTYVCVKILKIRIVIWSRHLFENFERCIDNTSLYILIISGHPFFFFLPSFRRESERQNWSIYYCSIYNYNEFKTKPCLYNIFFLTILHKKKIHI